MSQYSSRIHIKVSSPKVWSKFVDEDDASFELASLAETNQTSFIIDGEWSAVEDELTGIVEALAETLGEDGIIIADTTNINVDPYDYCILFLGTRVYTKEFSIYRDEEKCEMFFETSIEDIPSWLSYGEFAVSDKERAVLFRCGISSVGGHFEEFSADVKIPERVYLRETSFENRAERIEKTYVGEEVYFVHAKDSYDPLRLEVMSELGSLGYLPSDISEKLTPILTSERLKYVARIEEIVPVSKRNKHAKSAIVAICIDAEFSEEKVPLKTTVPKVDREALAEAAKRKAEEERKSQEEARKAEEERKRQEEVRKAEEERKRQEEARRAEEERKRQEEVRRAEEERKRQEEARKAEEERLRREEEARIARERTAAEAKAKKEAEEKRKAEEERKRQEQEALVRKYNEDYAAWEEQCLKIESERTKVVSEKLSREKLRLEGEAKTAYDAAVDTIRKKKAAFEKEKADADAALASLGFFRFGERKTQKSIIETAIAGISSMELELKKINSDYQSKTAGIPSIVDNMSKKIAAAVEKELPLPEKPKKPAL